MSTDLNTIQAAIVAWAQAATGLTAIWANQDGAPRPTGQYISLSATMRNVGRGWTERPNAAAPVSGGEVTSTHRTVKRLDLQIQCFAGDAVGDDSPMGKLSDMCDYAGLPSQRTALRSAGWTPVAFDTIQDASGLRGASYFEPRAVMSCYGYVVGEITEASTYVQKVQVENQITGDEFEVELPLTGFRVTEDGETRVTEADETRVTES